MTEPQRAAKSGPDASEPSRATKKTGTPPPAAAPAPAAPLASAAPEPQLTWKVTRRHQRVPMKEGSTVQIDGDEAVLMNLSESGAQVISSRVLRPNQRLRVRLMPDTRLSATVSWASFELSSRGPCYRAGIDFTDTDPRIAAFIESNRQPD